MNIQPYQLLDLEVKDPNQPILPATKITIEQLTPTNDPFAKKLAGLIDEMANQLAQR